MVKIVVGGLVLAGVVGFSYLVLTQLSPKKEAKLGEKDETITTKDMGFPEIALPKPQLTYEERQEAIKDMQQIWTNPDRKPASPEQIAELNAIREKMFPTESAPVRLPDPVYTTPVAPAPASRPVEVAVGPKPPRDMVFLERENSKFLAPSKEKMQDQMRQSDSLRKMKGF